MIEEEIARRYPLGKMRCPVHLSIGQEAAAVGICAYLKPSDRLVSTHRGHAHYLAKGGSLEGLLGELYGKATGCSKGNGGSMHLIDLNCGFYGSTSIVGGTIPIGVGIAFANRLQGKDDVTIICIGDAAIEEGVFHEAANFASLHKLKVIFACENNGYSCYTHLRLRQPHNKSYQGFLPHAIAHCLGYWMAGISATNIICVMKNAIESAQHGPQFVEIPTYRYLQHCGPDNDDHLGYRDQKEIEYWQSLDPLKDPPSDDVEKIKSEIEDAFRATEAAAFPDEEEAGRYVYAPYP